MNNFSENSTTKDNRIAKTVIKNNLQSCRSSQIIGRKINNGCLLVKSQKGKKLNSNVLLVQGKKVNEPRRKFIAKKSPGRSLSLNRVFSEKDVKTEVSSHISPPRGLKNYKEKASGMSQLLDELPKLEVSEAICPSTPQVIRRKKLKINKSAQVLDESSKIDKLSPQNNKKFPLKLPKKKQEKTDQSKDPEEKLKTLPKKPKSKNFCEKLPKKKITLKKIIIPKLPHDPKTPKDRKASETDDKIPKTDRESQKKRKKKGLELYSIQKPKVKKVNKSQDATKHKKNSDLLSFDYPKKSKIFKKLIDSLKDEAQKEKFQIKKPKNKKKKKSKSIWLDDEKTPLNKKVKTNTSSDEKRELSVENRLLKDQLYKLKQRVSKAKNELLSKSHSLNILTNVDKVVKIQRWFRKSLKNKRRESSSLNDIQIDKWPAVQGCKLVHRTSSDLVRSFDCKLFGNCEQEEKDFNVKREVNKCEDDATENLPKKIQKVPPLGLSFILQAKFTSDGNIAESAFGLILKDSLNSENSDKEIRNESPLSSSSSSSSQIKQVSNLDIENINSSPSEDNPDYHPNLNILTEEFTQNPQNTSNNSSLALKDSPETQPDLQHPSKPADSQSSPTQLITKPEIPLYPSSENSYSSSHNYENSPDILSGDLSYKDSDSPSSHYSDPDNSLKRILKNKSEDQPEIIERPGHNMIIDSDSSEQEEMNSNKFILHTDTNISEEKLEALSVSPKPYLNECNDIEKLICNEIELFVEGVKFVNRLKDVDPGIGFIEEYLKRLEEKLNSNEDEMLELINTPAYQDPFNKLECLQTTPTGKLNKIPALELILPQNLSSELKMEFSSLDVPSKQIYLQFIFDCVNEALNHIRPFALDGLPDPWSSVSSTLYGEGQIKVVFEKVKNLLRKWESIKCGIMTDKVDEPTTEKIKKLQEDRLNVLLAHNVKESETRWLWYEDEETQVKIDISDLVFDFLIEEISCLIKILP